MKTYDEIVEFDYTGIEEWKNFTKKQIFPLIKSISKIVKLLEDIEYLINDDLSNLIKNSTSAKLILLGGIGDNGEYRPNSLAKLYKEVLGISINPQEWVAYCKQSDVDASEYIKCNFSDTVFLQFIQALKEYIDKLLSLVGIDCPEVSEKEIDEIFENPEKIIDDLKAIYTYVINISANHNYHTFFILNTRCISRGYIEQPYPKLKNNFEELAEFLGLEPKFAPEVKEEKIKRDYTLWGHKENEFADLVYGLNGCIWKYFEEKGYMSKDIIEFRNIFSLILKTKLRDLRKEYMRKARLSLGSWQRIPQIHFEKGYDRDYTLKVENMLITEYWNNYSPKTTYAYEYHECRVSFLKFIDNLSPALFLTLISIKKGGGSYKAGNITVHENYIQKED